jgi:hypothetical protein
MRLLALGLCALLTHYTAADTSFPDRPRISLPQLIDVLESWRDANPNQAVNYHSLGVAYYLAAVRNAWRFNVHTHADTTDFDLPEIVRRQRNGSIDWDPPLPLPAEVGTRLQYSAERDGLI